VIISPQQCKEARKMLGWSRANCGKAAGIGPSTVYIFERGIVRQSTWISTALRDAFQSAGVEFIADHGGDAGVKLRKTK
jgi:DNA-binding XRE family transcriptional regulator